MGGRETGQGADETSFVVYPSWAERYLSLRWAEVPGLLADPFDSSNVNVEKENLAASLRSGFIAPVPFSVLDGDRGGGLIILGRMRSSLQATALGTIGDILRPEPMLAMWHMAGAPALPSVSVLEPSTTYKILLRAAGLPTPARKPPHLSFTLEFAPREGFRVYVISAKSFPPAVVDSLVNGLATLFTDRKRDCQVGEIGGDEYRAVVKRFEPGRPEVVALHCQTGGLVTPADVAAVIYLLHWLVDLHGIRLEACHLFGMLPGRPSFLPLMKSRKPETG